MSELNLDEQNKKDEKDTHNTDPFWLNDYKILFLTSHQLLGLFNSFRHLSRRPAEFATLLSSPAKTKK